MSPCGRHERTNLRTLFRRIIETGFFRPYVRRSPSGWKWTRTSWFRRSVPASGKYQKRCFLFGFAFFCWWKEHRHSRRLCRRQLCFLYGTNRPSYESHCYRQCGGSGRRIITRSGHAQYLVKSSRFAPQHGDSWWRSVPISCKSGHTYQSWSLSGTQYVPRRLWLLYSRHKKTNAPPAGVCYNMMY